MTTQLALIPLDSKVSPDVRRYAICARLNNGWDCENVSGWVYASKEDAYDALDHLERGKFCIDTLYPEDEQAIFDKMLAEYGDTWVWSERGGWDLRDMEPGWLPQDPHWFGRRSAA